MKLQSLTLFISFIVVLGILSCIQSAYTSSIITSSHSIPHSSFGKLFNIRGGKKSKAKKVSKVDKTKKNIIKHDEEDLPLETSSTDKTDVVLKNANNKPNVLIVDDSLTDDHSTITLHPSKMEELGLFSGDNVLLKGKKRKTTVAIVNADEDAMETKVKMTKVVRSNLRYLLAFYITSFCIIFYNLDYDLVIRPQYLL